MNNLEMLVLDYANFSGSSIPVTLLAIKLNKTTREIKYLKRCEPWEYERHLKEHQMELNSFKSLEYHPIPPGWFQRFLQSGGLIMSNGESLPSFESLKNSNDVY